MHTTRSLTISHSIRWGEGLPPNADPLNPPGCIPHSIADPPPPWMQIPLNADPLPPDSDPPTSFLDADPLVDADHPHPSMQIPLPPDADTPPSLLTMNRMTHRCKNTTLPQTLFAGGKYTVKFYGVLL